jgi:8-oxo-dGTP pyrophosphatase MutT (NUDIX family)
MAQSKFSTTQLFSEEFAESAGAVLFHLPTKQICLIHLKNKQEWLLPKGRRNCTESRQQAALREVREETGYDAHILPVNMSVRAPPAVEIESYYPDEPRYFETVAEPFVLTLRQIGERNQKIIWWYIASIEERSPGEVNPDENVEASFFSYSAAVDKLTYELDREIVRKAIDLVTATYHMDDAQSIVQKSQ